VVLEIVVDKKSLWFKVLVTRYGVDGSRLMDGGRTASSWWRDIVALHREELFSDHVSREVGNERLTRFWTDVWVGGVTLRDQFYRLFELSLFKEMSVFDICQLGWGEDGEAWKWRRRLFVWEGEMVGDLCLLLQKCEFAGW